MASQPPAWNPSGHAADPSETENSTATRSRIAFPNIEPATALQDPAPANVSEPGKRKRKNRAGKKRRNRRQSFAALDMDTGGMTQERPSLIDPTTTSSVARDSFYRLQVGNRSDTSLESEALLDHRYFYQSHLRTFRLTSHVVIMGLFKLVDKAHNKRYCLDALSVSLHFAMPYERVHSHTHLQAKVNRRG